MSLAPWTTALDAFERSLAEQREAVARGDAGAVDAFSPPAGLGPLPRELADRARALLAASQEHVDELRTTLASTQRELALLDRMAPAGASPSYLDQAM